MIQIAIILQVLSHFGQNSKGSIPDVPSPSFLSGLKTKTKNKQTFCGRGRGGREGIEGRCGRVRIRGG